MMLSYGDADVLFLILQYLESLDLHSSALKLSEETGLDSKWLCGPSLQVATLRDFVFRGEWNQVHTLLQPLARAMDHDSVYQNAMETIRKQMMMEEYFDVETETKRRLELWNTLLRDPQVTRNEIAQCRDALYNDTSSVTSWKREASRMACFEALIPLFRDDVDPEDEESKYLAASPRHLVALLNDAILYHRNRGHDVCDYISITPDSSDRTIDDKESLDHSPLWLGHISNREDKTTISAKEKSRFRRSIDLSHRDRKSDGFSYDSTTKPDFIKPTTRPNRRNPLAISMNASAFMKSRLHATSWTSDNSLEENVVEMEEVVDTKHVESVSNMPMITTHDMASQTDIETVAVTVPPCNNNQTAEVDVSNNVEVVSSPISPEDKEVDIVALESRSPLTPTAHNTIASSALIDDEGEENTSENLPTAVDHSLSTTHPRSYADLTLDSIVCARVVAQVSEAQAPRAMDIAPSGIEVVIGTNARALRVFDLTEALERHQQYSSPHSFLPLLPVAMEKHKHHSSSIYCATYNQESTNVLIATGAAESSIKILKRSTQQEVGWIQAHSGKCRALTFASANILCSATSGDFVIRCWDVESLTSRMSSPTYNFDGHVGEIQALAIIPTISQTPELLLSAAMDRTIRLWDWRSRSCARVIARSNSPVFSVAIQPSQHQIFASGHQDGSVSLWDLRATTRRPLSTISTHHQDECRALSWSPDGQWLLSASFDGTLVILEQSNELMAVASYHQHTDKILQAQWHPTMPAIVTTGADKYVKLWGFV